MKRDLIEQRLGHLVKHGGFFPAPASRRLVLTAAAVIVVLQIVNIVLAASL